MSITLAPMIKVKIGLIGAGHLGKIHLKLLKEIAGFELVGFYDSDPAAVAIIEKEFGIKAYQNFEELVEKCDAIDIVTPTAAHFDYAAYAAFRFKHYFVEKPLTSTLAEARKLLSLTDEARVKAMVGHVERFNPAYLSIKDKAHHPLFIEVHRLAQFNPRGTDVSVVLDLMIHDIDLILSLVKASVKKVSASGVAIISDTPDIANARIEFDNGCVANLTASRISVKNMRKMRLFQQGAYISMDFLKKKAETFSIHEHPIEEGNTFELDIPGKPKKYIQFEQENPAENNAIKMELEAFWESIAHNKPVPVSIQDGLNAMEVGYMILDKIKRQRVVSTLA